MRLNQLQVAQLLHWLAQDIKYPELKRLMDEAWGEHITSPAVTSRRRAHKAEIQQLKAEMQALERRRERDRYSKQRRRSGLASLAPHCATCQCQTIAKAG